MTVMYQSRIENDIDDYDDIPDLVSDDDEDDEEEINYETVYFKYEFDGCQNIDEVIQQLENLKVYFQTIKNEGHNLLQPVDSGHCILTKIRND
jgi:hypothetical protein